MSMSMIEELAGVVGDENAFAVEEQRASPYRRLFGDHESAGFVAVALPGDVQELQGLVRAITERGHAISVCANAAANGAVRGADERPAVLIDQRRMNRILEVNEYSAYALVEPGVSYRQLYEHLQRNGTALWIDCDGNRENSVAASICSRQLGYTPYGNHMLMQCGMEVVLPDGDLLRTGMGALPGSDTWQLTKYSFGPYLDGLFSQSNLGVVSKIGLWLMPAPPAFHPFMVTLDGTESLVQMVETLRPLVISGAIPNPIAIANAAFETVLEHGVMTHDPAAPGKSSGLGEWNVFGALYGTRENIDLTWEMVSGTVSQVEGAVLFTETQRSEDPIWRRRADLMRGVPVVLNYTGLWNEGSSFRVTAVAPIDGEHAARMQAIAVRSVAALDVALACEYVLYSRTLFMRNYLVFVEDDAIVRSYADKAIRALIANLVEAGYGIVDESPSLRRVVDGYYRGSGLDNLAARLRAAMYS